MATINNNLQPHHNNQGKGPQATELSPIMKSIKDNAAIMWPDENVTFDVQILHNQQKVHAVLVQLGGAMPMPRTTSEFYGNEAEALEDIKNQLIYMVEEKKAFEGITHD